MLLPLLIACTAGTVKLPEETPAETGGMDPGDADTAETAAPEETGETGAPATVGGAALADAMDIDRLLAHLDALQEAADADEGTRVVGSDAYETSARYVAGQLEAAGYAVTWQEFAYPVFDELSPPTLESAGTSWTEGEDFQTFTYSGSGEASGPIVAVDLILPPADEENTSTSGCQASDFIGFPAGAIALIQRGTCTFAEKAAYAQAAGASGVIIFNEGQPGRTDLFSSSVASDGSLGIPAVSASFALGEALAALDGVEGRLVVDAVLEDRPTWNLLADLSGDPSQILVVGAHLDSVTAGPGINDNGSGTALVLELAIQSAALGLAPSPTLRFAFWGAEEAGLIGSYVYVGSLSDDALDAHVGNLNFDMIGSPNGGRFVYDGDGSARLGGYPAPDGSAEIEALFTGWLDAQGQIWEATAFDGRSDYGPFIYAGIPAGGLFSGAEETKAPGEVAGWGGEAGSAYDACYHQGCDTRENLDELLLLDLARAGAWTTGELAVAGLDAPPGRTRERREHGPVRAGHGGCGEPIR